MEAGVGSLFFAADFLLFFALFASLAVVTLIFFFATVAAAADFGEPFTFEDFAGFPRSFDVSTTVGSTGASAVTITGALAFSNCVVKAAAASVSATTCDCSVS